MKQTGLFPYPPPPPPETIPPIMVLYHDWVVIGYLRSKWGRAIGGGGGEAVNCDLSVESGIIIYDLKSDQDPVQCRQVLIRALLTVWKFKTKTRWRKISDLFLFSLGLSLPDFKMQGLPSASCVLSEPPTVVTLCST